jgi:hypothetical protein
MAMPLVMLRNMLLPLRKKLGLAVIFSLVLVTVVIDILRTVFTLLQYPNTLLALLEASMTVIACYLTCFGSLLSQAPKQLFGSFITSSRASPRALGPEVSLNFVRLGLDSSRTNEREEC